MNQELKTKILDLLRNGSPMKMQEIADCLGMEKVTLYQEGLRHLVDAGEVEKIIINQVQFFRARHAQNTETTTHGEFKNINTKGGGLNAHHVRILNNAHARDLVRYPETPEEVITAAYEIDYPMSLREGSKFISVYGAYDWESLEGRKIRSWKKLLHVWKSRQTPAERAQGLKEKARREQGLPPMDPADLEYEYYEDAQGRKWRKKFDSTEWEFVPEEITFSDGQKAVKGVV